MRLSLTIMISMGLTFALLGPIYDSSNVTKPDIIETDPLSIPLALDGKKICVDPGHGGSDTGTPGIDGPGYPDEKDHNLDMALRLRFLLELKGASVFMTRETDVDVSLQGRCDIANNNNTDIFVSIHCNSVGVETVSGTETFYWGVDAVTYSVNGKRLAENVQSELVAHLGSNDRGAKADFPYFGFHLYVLDHTIMPAILTEVGFMSNQTEFDLLNQTWYRQEAAQAMCDGIMAYFRTPHAPIRINSNADFDEAHGIVNWATGDGSAGNPWIIENWDIDGTGYGYCIYVGNTTEHFVVRDCVLHNSNGVISEYYRNTGLYLYNGLYGKIENNTAFSNDGHGIRFQNSGLNLIINNKVYDNNNAIYLINSNFNDIINNNITGDGDINLESSFFNHVHNNSILDADGISLSGACDNFFTNNIVTQSILHGINIWENSNRNYFMNNIISWNNWNGVHISGDFGNSNNNAFVNNTISHNGMRGFGDSNSQYNIIDNNNVFNNGWDGIFIFGNAYAYVRRNTITNNSDSGISVTNGYQNHIFHNNIIDNTPQAGNNNDLSRWNDTYPSGGNYWSDYAGVDLYHGPNQDLLGSDGIGDTSYTNIQGGSNADEYPLMSPFEYTEYDIPLQQGWNLISLPVRQLNWSIDSVLESITGKWDCIQTFDSTDESWKSNNIYRPASLNDLNEMNHLHGYWLNTTEPGVNLTVKGDMFGSTLSIPLKAGWNLVGYPSLVEKTVSTSLAGTSYDSIMGFNATEPYRLSMLDGTDTMKPGEAYWVRVPSDVNWVIDW